MQFKPKLSRGNKSNFLVGCKFACMHAVAQLRDNGDRSSTRAWSGSCNELQWRMNPLPVYIAYSLRLLNMLHASASPPIAREFYQLAHHAPAFIGPIASMPCHMNALIVGMNLDRIRTDINSDVTIHHILIRIRIWISSNKIQNKYFGFGFIYLHDFEHNIIMIINICFIDGFIIDIKSYYK